MAIRAHKLFSLSLPKKGFKKEGTDASVVITRRRKGGVPLELTTYIFLPKRNKNESTT